MPTGDYLIAAAALIRHNGQILLVQQQGPDHHVPTWALPGGLLDPGELLHDGLARELMEETGLTLIDPGSLLYVAHKESGTDSLIAFIFDVHEWTGELAPDDPDGYILDARFLPIADAIDRLEAIPWRPMREPIVAWLRGESDRGALWCYRDDEHGAPRLIER